MSKKKKLSASQIEQKLNKDLENQLMNNWEAFRELMLDDCNRPFKFHKVDVCKAIKNFMKTGEAKIPDEIEIPSNEFLKAQAERMWDNIVSYEKHIQGK